MRILQNNKVSEKHYRITNEVYQEKVVGTNCYIML